jgi:hypothetical protein
MEHDAIYADGNNYRPVQSARLGGTVFVVGESLEATRPYLVWRRSVNEAFGAQSHIIPVFERDYLSAMRGFIRQLEVALDSLDLERVYRGSPLIDAPLLPEDCVPGGMDDNLTGKVIAIRQEILSPEYRFASHQLHLAAGGFGCYPDSRGRAVYCTDLYSGENERFAREDVLGVIAEDALPEWAKENLAALRDPANRESTLAKLREGKKTAAEQPRKEKDKGHRTREPEL